MLAARMMQTSSGITPPVVSAEQGACVRKVRFGYGELLAGVAAGTGPVAIEPAPVLVAPTVAAAAAVVVVAVVVGAVEDAGVFSDCSHCSRRTMDGSDLAPSMNSSRDKRPSEFLSICLNIFSVRLSGVASSSGIFIVVPIIL